MKLFSSVGWEEEPEKVHLKYNDEDIELNVYNDEVPPKETLDEKRRENAELKRERRLKNVIVDSDNRGLKNDDQESPERDVVLVRKPNNRELYEFSNSFVEKETRVEKSPTEKSDYYRVIEDIKFADDEEDEVKVENLKCENQSPKPVKKDKNESVKS